MAYIATTMGATLTPIRVTLREAREAAGLTQAELAEKADVRQATISDMETGKRRSIDLILLDRICRVLGVEAGSLFEQDPPIRRRR